MGNYFLSENDRKLIQELINRSKRDSGPFPDQPTNIQNSPDVYITKPAYTIPAISDIEVAVGTGTGIVDMPSPSYGRCEIYRVIIENEGNTLQAVENFSQKVYNLSGNDLNINEWIVVQRDRFGDWIAPPGSGFTEYNHSYIMMKGSIAPGGNAKAYKLKWFGNAWVQDAKFFQYLKINYSDNTYISNVQNSGESREEFADGDVGKILTIVDGTDFTTGDYTVTHIREKFYNDLVIVEKPALDTIVSSQASSFTALDLGQQLVIDSGTGFIPSIYIITTILADGTAQLGGNAGTIGSTGGVAHQVPMAKVDSALGTEASTEGSGFFGAIEVYDVQNSHRAWGLDDIADPLLHLIIDDSLDFKITNTGLPFVSGDVGKTVIIDASTGTGNTPGEGFDGGSYVVQSVSSGVATLDRSIGNLSSYEGTGLILRTDAAIGIVEYHPISEHWEIVTLHCIAKIARATLGQNIIPSNTDIKVFEMESMDGGQATLPDVVISSYSDLDLVAETDDTIISYEQPFTENDEGLVIVIETGCSLDQGTYLISSVNVDGEATLDRPAIEEAIGTGSGSGDFNCSGDTYKPLEVYNNGSGGAGGTVFKMFWDETNDRYEITDDVSSGYDHCTAELIKYLATTDSDLSVNTVKVVRGSSPLKDPTSTTEALLVYNPHDIDTNSGEWCEIRWNKTTVHWEIVDAPCVVGTG